MYMYIWVCYRRDAYRHILLCIYIYMDICIVYMPWMRFFKVVSFGRQYHVEMKIMLPWDTIGVCIYSYIYFIYTHIKSLQTHM